MAFLEGLTTQSGVRILAGEKGRVYHSSSGEITFLKAPLHGIDRNLYACLKGTVDHLGISIGISSVDTGAHTRGSRHYRGIAVDIALLSHHGDKMEPTRWPDALADELAAWFRACGFRPYEGGQWPALLWGAPRSSGNQTAVDHRDHLHCSLCPKPLPGASEEEELDGEERVEIVPDP